MLGFFETFVRFLLFDFCGLILFCFFVFLCSYVHFFLFPLNAHLIKLKKINALLLQMLENYKKYIFPAILCICMKDTNLVELVGIVIHFLSFLHCSTTLLFLKSFSSSQFGRSLDFFEKQHLLTSTNLNLQ
jgi:hypothetical protein